jgi:hypothetical protein
MEFDPVMTAAVGLRAGDERAAMRADETLPTLVGHAEIAAIR